MSTVYKVRLKSFEGPLDLLLHLISKAKVDIEDISIADITEQYLEYLDSMKDLDMEIASEFLVMASTLVYIKSRSLVPNNRYAKDEDCDEIDSQEKLIQRLIEYRQYKKIGEKLQSREDVYKNIYERAADEILLKEIESEILYGFTREDLLRAFKEVSLNRRESKNGESAVHFIKPDYITIEDRKKELNSLLTEKKRLNFFELFQDTYIKMDVVITFLALLEMIKGGQVRLYQRSPFEDITISKRG